jgi:hypothetical protein
MKNSKIAPYLAGFLLNVVGFFVASNILIEMIAKLFILSTEYQNYLLWCTVGLMGAWIGNIVGVLLLAPKKVLRTIIGSLAGLFIGLMLSFMPMMYFIGIATIFLGTLFGHCTGQESVT